MLYNKGVYLNACFDELNLTNPDTVKGVQQEYIQSGVDIIETNTFGGTMIGGRSRFKKKTEDLMVFGLLVSCLLNSRH